MSQSLKIVLRRKSMAAVSDTKGIPDHDSGSQHSRQKHEISSVPIADIARGRHRRLNLQKISELVESMMLVGHQTPITVRRTDVGYVLVAGQHRLEAAKMLGWRAIKCQIFDGDDARARLWQISENLHRSELTALERAQQTAEWVRLTDSTKPISGQVDQKSLGGRPPGGIAQAARELPVKGKTEDARRKYIERAIKIDAIAPEAKAAAVSAGLDDNQAVLLDIARAGSPSAQLAKIKTRDRRLRRRGRRILTTEPAAAIEATMSGVVFADQTGPSKDRSEAAGDATVLANLTAAWDKAVDLKRTWATATRATQSAFISEIMLADT